MRINDILINSESFNELARDYLTSGLIGHINFEDYINFEVKRQYKNTDIDGIKEAVCSYYGIEKTAIDTPTRKRAIVQKRQLAMALSRKYTTANYFEIGRKIGKKDHSTVMYACSTIENLIQTDKRFCQEVKDIKKMLCVR